MKPFQRLDEHEAAMRLADIPREIEELVNFFSPLFGNRHVDHVLLRLQGEPAAHQKSADAESARMVGEGGDQPLFAVQRFEQRMAPAQRQDERDQPRGA